MVDAGCPLIQAVLLNPALAAGLAPAQWDLLIRQGRSANLLARLAELLLAGSAASPVPEAPRRHLESALRIAERQRVSCRWELDCIASALADTGTQVVVLKGAAYAALGLPFATTRLFSDVDILVPKDDLATVETALLIKGWHFDDMSAYDQRYYRRWMHELPPLRHRRRGTTIDVHHTLLPPTARLKLDATVLFDQLVALPQHPGLRVLPPTSMLLHSATHLFHEGEFGNGLRDLFDLDALVRQFGPLPGFWPALAAQAGAMGVGRPLFYALTLCTRLLGSPVPAEAMARAERDAPWGPARPLMLRLYQLALAPLHSSCATPARRLAWLLLYLRSHWLRMPTALLAAHLARKVWWRFSGAEAREAERRQRVPGAA